MIKKIPEPVSFILRFGTVISGILALVIICIPIMAPLFVHDYKIPSSIENWGGVIIGFYFGSFISQVGNFLHPSGKDVDISTTPAKIEAEG